MARDPEFEGRYHTIVCLELPDGSCPVGDFIDDLDPADRRKLDVLFERLGEQGKISNAEKFKKLAGSEKIFEFKSFQIRILCFHGLARTVQLAHAVFKKKDKHSPSDVALAEERRRRYFSD